MRKEAILLTRKSKTIAYFLLAMCLSAALSSCGVRGKHMPIETYRAPDDPGVLAAAQDPTTALGIERSYLIGIRDVVEVTVTDHIEFSGNFKVEEDGTIEIPTIFRRVRLSGLTARQAEGRICDALSDLVVGKSQARIKVLLSRSRHYYILGAVGRQGKYFMSLEDVTVRDALIAGNLWGRGAKRDLVYIITPDERNRPSYVTVDGESILMGSLRNDVILKPGDIVYVPTTLYFRINNVLDEIIGQTARAQEIEGDMVYGQTVGKEGYGRLTESATP